MESVKMKDEIIIGIGGLILSALTYFAGVVRTERRYKAQAEEERIAHFIDNFNNSRKFGHQKRVIEHLIPSGINNLKNDKEIESVLLNLERVHGRHPLQNNNEEIKQIGYKDFFIWSSKQRGSLTKDNINDFIEHYKKEH